MSAVEQISLYNTLFYVFAGIAALGLSLSVFFFIYFDIPAVYAMMTGKAKRDTIRKMEEANAAAGKVRRPYPTHTGDMKRSGRLGNSGKTHSGKVANVHRERIPATEPPQTAETGVLHRAASETEVLHRAASETEVLHEELGATAPLKRPAEQMQPQVAPAQNTPQIRFQITENTMVIHTDELI